MARKKPKLVQVIEPPLVPYTRYETEFGTVVVYIPSGEPATVERCNWLLDVAKNDLLFNGPSGRGKSA